MDDVVMRTNLWILLHIVVSAGFIWLFVLSVSHGVFLVALLLGILGIVWFLHVGLTISYIVRDVRRGKWK